MAVAHLEYPFARAHPAVIPRRQRRVPQPDRIVGNDTPVVRIELALEARAPVRIGEGHVRAAQRGPGRLQDGGPQIIVLDGGAGYRDFRLQPPRPAMAARVVTHSARHAFVGAVLAAFKLLEVLAHVLGAPRLVPGEVGQLVPVRVVRAHEDEGVVRGAPAQRSRARVEQPRAPAPAPSRAWGPSSAAHHPRNGGRSSPTACPCSRSRARERRGRRSRRGASSLRASGEWPRPRFADRRPLRAAARGSQIPPGALRASRRRRRSRRR